MVTSARTQSGVAARSWLTPRCVWLVAGLALSGGCAPAASGPAAPPPAGLQVSEPVVPGPPAAPSQAAEELWWACYLNGAKVGHSHTKIEPLMSAEEPQVRYWTEEQLVVRRFGQQTEVRTQLSCLETAAGQVREFRSVIQTGPGSVVAEGRCQADQLVVKTSSEGQESSERIVWNPAWGGFLADRQSLRRRPMKPRETRQLTALLPVILKAGDTRLEARGYEATKLLADTRQLLRIEATTQAGKTQLRSILWTDETGEAWKTRDLQLGLEAFLTTREAALSPETGSGYDLGEATTVRIEQPLQNPHQTRRVRYRARLQDGDVHTLFASGPTQTLERVDERTEEITVQAIRPGDLAPGGAREADRPAESDRVASPLLQSDAPVVVQMAQSVAPHEADPWSLACALESHVKRSIRLKNYSTAMATAAEVARTLEGDCTEHAMLLAALCRARQIPARVAVGLVYYAPARAFAYHMWTEVWMGDLWIPLDATLGLGGIGAAHLKLTSTNLSGATAYADLLPVVQAIGRLELEVVSVEY